MRKFLMPALAGLVGLAALAATAGAQTANPVSDALREAAKGAQRNLVASAEEMPADKYGYHPTAGQRTFGALVLHVAMSNDFFCEKINGTPAPKEAKLTATSPKSALVAALKASFDYCAAGFAKLTDSGLSDSVPFFGGRKVTRAAIMMDAASDWADHYSTAADYLRMNGMLPPTAKRGGM